MLGSLQDLPNASPAARLRFVVLATAFSFAVILAVWAGVVRLTRPAAVPGTVAAPAGPAAPAAAPVVPPAAVPPPASAVSEGAPASLVDALQQPAAPVDVGQISANLLKAIGGGR